MSSQTLFRAVLVAGALALCTPAPEARAQSTYATEMNYGREAFDGSNFALAQRHFKGAFEAASTDGQKATALYSMAVALQRQGRFEEAKEPAAKAVELSPKHSQAKALIDELNNATSRPQPKAAAGKGAAPAAVASVDPLAKIEEEERAAIKRAREKGLDLAGEPLNRKPGTTSAKDKETVAPRETAAREREARKEPATARETREPRETAAKAKESRDSAISAAPKSEPAPKTKDTVAAATPRTEPAAPKAKEPKEAPPPKEAAAPKAEPTPSPVVAAIIKKKPQPPVPTTAPAAPAAPAAALTTAAATSASAVTSPIDYSALGKLEPNGARLIISGPPIQAPLLAAGFTSNDRTISIVTGPARAADGTENAIEFRQIDIQSGKAGDIYALHADAAAALASVPASAASLITAVPAGKKGRAVSIHTWDPASIANVDAVELEGSGKDLPIALDALVASRNGQRVAAVHSTGVQIFNVKGLRGASSFRFQARADVSAPVAAAMSGNGQRVAVSNGARLRFIDRSNVREIGPGSANQPIDVVALSEAGDLIAASSANSVRLIDAVTGRDLEGLPNAAHPITALAFSPTSDRLALAFYDRVQVWTVADRKLAVELDTSANAGRMAFSGDGRLLLASGASGTRVWLVDPIASPAIASAAPTLQAAPAAVTAAVAVPATPPPAAPAPVAAVPSSAPAAPEPVKAAAAAAPAETPKPEPAIVAAASPPPAAETRPASAPPARTSGFTEQQPKTTDAAPAVAAAPAPAETQVAAATPPAAPAAPAEAAPAPSATSAQATSAGATPPPVTSAEAQTAPAQVAAAAPAPVKPDPRKLAQLKSQRGRALNQLDCDRVRALDTEIGDAPRHDECVAKAAQAERTRELARLATDRIAALNAGDCERVKGLDAEIGSGDVHASCVAKAEQAKRTAELNQLTADRQAAFARFDCAAVKELDTKIGSGELFDSCNIENLIKSGSARDLYLAAAKSDADRKLAEARKYYRAIVDRHPQDDLAIKAAERMTALSDLEKQENNAQIATGSTRERARTRPRPKRRQ